MPTGWGTTAGASHRERRHKTSFAERVQSCAAVASSAVRPGCLRRVACRAELVPRSPPSVKSFSQANVLDPLLFYNCAFSRGRLPTAFTPHIAEFLLSSRSYIRLGSDAEDATTSSTVIEFSGARTAAAPSLPPSRATEQRRLDGSEEPLARSRIRLQAVALSSAARCALNRYGQTNGHSPPIRSHEERPPPGSSRWCLPAARTLTWPCLPPAPPAPSPLPSFHAAPHLYSARLAC